MPSSEPVTLLCWYMRETERAVQVSVNDERFLWVPRKAIVDDSLLVFGQLMVAGWYAETEEFREATGVKRIAVEVVNVKP